MRILTALFALAVCAGAFGQVIEHTGTSTPTYALPNGVVVEFPEVAGFTRQVVHAEDVDCGNGVAFDARRTGGCSVTRNVAARYTPEANGRTFTIRLHHTRDWLANDYWHDGRGYVYLSADLNAPWQEHAHNILQPCKRVGQWPNHSTECLPRHPTGEVLVYPFDCRADGHGNGRRNMVYGQGRPTAYDGMGQDFPGIVKRAIYRHTRDGNEPWACPAEYCCWP